MSSTAFIEQVQRLLEPMRRCCADRFQTDHYWDLGAVLTADVVQDPGTVITNWAGEVQYDDGTSVRLELADGYEVKILFMHQGWGYPTHFNGYVKIPSWAPFARDTANQMGYTVLQEEASVERVELTYSYDSVIGWDHGHFCDADLSSSTVKPFTSGSGPVQVFEEAMSVVRDLRRYESRRQAEVAAQRLAVFEEELMAKAWHPTRVMAWVEAGVDM